MTLNEIYELYRLNVVKIFTENVQGDTVTLAGYGTGFLTGDGYLITNFHVFEKSIRGIRDNKYGVSILTNHPIKVAYQSIKNPSIFGTEFDKQSERLFRPLGTESIPPEKLTGYLTFKDSGISQNDYIILRSRMWVGYKWEKEFFEKLKIEGSYIPDGNVKYGGNILKFGSPQDVYIGKKVALLGYSFEQERLSVHQGYISTIYKSNGIDVYQIDGSVNSGNSGGPLVDMDSGKIIGIVTRKEDGFSEIFKNIRKKYEAQLLEQESKLSEESTSGVENPLRMLYKESLSQFLELAKVIERNANVGIGYAFPIDKIADDINELRQEDKEKTDFSPDINEARLHLFRKSEGRSEDCSIP